jgi:hypothetical protein
MKRTSITLFGILLSVLALAQSEKYYETMGKTIAELYATKDPSGYDAVINKFVRIGQAEKSQWEPYYYAALGQSFHATGIEDPAAKDAQLDKALNTLSEAAKLSANNSEILSLEGFIWMLKLGVDPGTRGQAYTGKIMGLFGQAMALDPQNPRAVLFMGQMKYGTAQFFGAGTDEACGLVQKSIALFENYQPKSPISPMWGKSSAVGYAQRCGNQ